MVVSGRAFGRGQLSNLKANRVAMGKEINGSISGEMTSENNFLVCYHYWWHEFSFKNDMKMVSTN